VNATGGDGPATGPSPVVRPRRLRRTEALRRLVAEHRLHPAQLVEPLFVKEGLAAPVPVPSLPGVVQHSLASLPGAVERAARAGLGGVMLFGVPVLRDAVGSEATNPDGILTRGVAAAADAAGGRLVVMADLCLDEFTDHGHCGVLDARGEVDNDATLERYAEMARVLAAAGGDVLGLSGMMDGQVAAVRAALDGAGFAGTSILAYAAKYASAFYGPFRDAVDSRFTGNRRAYQLDPPNRREGRREVALDVAEGADIVMVKPALGYLDVLADVAASSPVPVAAYQVSGECAMVEAAAERGWIDREAAVLEALTAITRAGADIVLTYWAVEVADRLAGRGAR
jgi:porphobilinogen synthase